MLCSCAARNASEEQLCPVLSRTFSARAEGTAALGSLCLCKPPPSPSSSAAPERSGVRRSPDARSVHAASRLRTAAGRTDRGSQVTLDTRRQQQTFPRQLRDARLGPAFPGHRSPSRRNRVPLTARGCRTTAGRGLQHGTNGTRLGKG